MADYAAAFANLDPGADRLDASIDLLWSTYQGPGFIAWAELWMAARTDETLRAAVVEMDRDFLEQSWLIYAEMFPRRPPPKMPSCHRLTLRHRVRRWMDGAALRSLVPHDHHRPPEELIVALKFVAAQTMAITPPPGRGAPTMNTATDVLPDEEGTPDVDGDAQAGALVRRLSHQSVSKHFDAYADVAWDTPHMAIDPGDPRWELTENWTRWAGRLGYEGLPQPTRAAPRPGVDRHADEDRARVRARAQARPARVRRHPAQWCRVPVRLPRGHRGGPPLLDVPGVYQSHRVRHSRTETDGPGRMRWVVRLGRRFPSLFFIFVLGGEDPIDFVQQEVARSAKWDRAPPTGLAHHADPRDGRGPQHLSFARHYLKQQVPQLGPIARLQLTVGAPLVLASMAQMMLRPPRRMVQRYEIPAAVIKEALHQESGPQGRHPGLTAQGPTAVRGSSGCWDRWAGASGRLFRPPQSGRPSKPHLRPRRFQACTTLVPEGPLRPGLRQLLPKDTGNAAPA